MWVEGISYTTAFKMVQLRISGFLFRVYTEVKSGLDDYGRLTTFLKSIYFNNNISIEHINDFFTTACLL